MSRLLAGLTAAALLVGVAAGSAHAAQPAILLCYGESQFNTYPSQMPTNLNPGNMYFSKVDLFDCGKNTPTVQQLKMYDGVMVWNITSALFANRSGLGDALADYVDAGGGVVSMHYNFYKSFTDASIGGRWSTGGYDCITPGASTAAPTSKAQPNDAMSPLVKGVMSLTALTSINSPLMQGATSVWDYNNNAPMIAQCMINGRLRVDLNFNPNPSYWKGDGWTIMQNALVTVAIGLTPFRAMPSPLVLPDTGVGATSVPSTVTFTNTSMGPATATGLALTGANAGDFGIIKQPQWPITVQPGGTFTIDVAFAPTAQGSRSAKLSVAIMGNNVTPSEVTLQGNAIGAKLSIDPNPIIVGGTKLGVAIQKVVTISNVGGGKLTLQSLAIGNPAFSISNGPDLPVVISSGGAFQITVGFSALANGTTQSTLVLTTNDKNSPTISVPVTGYAGQQALGTDAGSIAFGSVNVGAKSVEQIVQVQNVGFSDLKVTNIALSGQNAADFLLDKKMLPGTIPAQGSAPIGVIFAPSATGSRLGLITVTSDDPLKPTATVNMFGTATQTTLVVSTKAVDLGTVRVGQTGGMNGDVSITAMGSGTLKVLTIAITGNDAVAFVQGAGKMAPFNVAPNASEKITFACKPQSIGALTATANVVTDVGSAMVSLKCTGSSPRISVSPNVIDFGVIPVDGTSAKIPVTISNLGTDVLQIDGIAINGPDFSDFVSDDMPQVFPEMIAVGKSLTFSVKFTPTSAAQESANIVFSTDDPLLPMGKIALSGIGATAGLSIVPGTVDCGIVAVGQQSQPVAATIMNTGGIPLTITSVVVKGPSSGQFRLDRTIDKMNPVTLAPKDSISINVTYSASAAGTQTASLSVDAMGLAMPVAVAVKGTGYAPMVKPRIQGGGNVLDFGDVTVDTESEAKEVQLANLGTGPVQIGSVTVDNAAFTVDASMATAAPIAPMATASVFVKFKPSTDGQAKGNMSVKLAGGTSAIAVVGLVGNGVVATDGGGDGGGCAVAGRSHGARGAGLLAVLLVGLLFVRRRRVAHREVQSS